ncbi:hypothetical protein ACWEQG_01630 [Microbispora sp. NPDC004025]
MGWASAGDIFDPVARELIQMGAAPEIKRRVCSVLVKALQGPGWDTEGESLGEFDHDPAIVEAFREHGIVQPCADESGPEGASWCERERGHGGDDDDKLGHTWTRAEEDS